MTNVIDDVKDGIEENWNDSVIERPHVTNGADEYIKSVKGFLPLGDGEIVYITNPKTVPRYVDPRKEYKDVLYEVRVEMMANSAGARDKIFDEVYRIIEATGISTYENRDILEYTTENQHKRFSSRMRFQMMKYNELVSR